MTNIKVPEILKDDFLQVFKRDFSQTTEGIREPAEWEGR